MDFNFLLNTSKKQFLKNITSVHITSVLMYNISDYMKYHHNAI